MDHCALMEVLYYALCGIPGGSRGELTQYPRMVRVLEGHEVFGLVQARRIDWNQEMFKEEEVREQAEAVPASEKASSSEQPMEVDDEGKETVPEQVVAVDATKVVEEKEEEADMEGEETMGVKWKKGMGSRAVVVIRCSGVE